MTDSQGDSDLSQWDSWKSEKYPPIHDSDVCFLVPIPTNHARLRTRKHSSECTTFGEVKRRFAESGIKVESPEELHRLWLVAQEPGADSQGK